MKIPFHSRPCSLPMHREDSGGNLGGAGSSPGNSQMWNRSGAGRRQICSMLHGNPCRGPELGMSMELGIAAEQNLGWCQVVCGPFGSSVPLAQPQADWEMDSSGSRHCLAFEEDWKQPLPVWKTMAKEGIVGSMGGHTGPSPADLSRQRAIASPAGKPSTSREQRGEGELRGRCIYSSLLRYHPAGMQPLAGGPRGAQRGRALLRDSRQDGEEGCCSSGTGGSRAGPAPLGIERTYL